MRPAARRRPAAPRPLHRTTTVGAPRLAAAAAILLAVGAGGAGCGGGTDVRLSEVRDLRVFVVAHTDDKGASTVSVSLEFTPPAGVRCAILGSLGARLDGARFDDVYPGEWRDTSLAGSAAYCARPVLRLHHPRTDAGAASSTLVLSDDGGSLTIQIASLWATRSVALEPPAGGTLHLGEPLHFAVTGAAADLDPSLRVIVSTADLYCKTHVPVVDLMAARANGGYEAATPPSLPDGPLPFSCKDSPTLPRGVPVGVVATAWLAAHPDVTRCDGDASCRVTWSRSFPTPPFQLVP